MGRLLRGLKGHPGVLPATAFTIYGGFAGGWGGAAIMGGMCWVPMLLTAWSSGKRKKEVAGE